MNWSRSIVEAYRSHVAATDRAKWAKDHPDLWRLLEWAAGLAKDSNG